MNKLGGDNVNSSIGKGLRVAALTQGASVPSTRFRWSQYEPDLCAAGFSLNEHASLAGAYAPHSKWRRPFWLGRTLTESLWRVQKIHESSDVCFLQRNLVATLATWERFIRIPLVFDVDDAIFLGPRGASANRIAQQARVIVCGNSYLAEHFCRYGDVEVLPTAVDALRFRPSGNEDTEDIVIGWSGTSGGFQYLYQIEDALANTLKARPRAILKIVADRPPKFKSLPLDQVRFEAWTASTEVESLQTFSVGIMPLADDDWSRGKCSFKMLTYMSIGIPVVVSPVGMNIEVLEKGACGLSAKSKAQWVDALIHIIDDVAAQKTMGRVGRNVVEKYYSRDVIGPRLAGIISTVACS